MNFLFLVFLAGFIVATMQALPVDMLRYSNPLQFENPSIYGRELIDDLQLLKSTVQSRDFVGALKLSSQMAEVMYKFSYLFPFYVCREPTHYAEYIDYTTTTNWIDKNSIPEGVCWSYRLGVYQVQLKLILALKDETKQRTLMGTKEDSNPRCYNPIILQDENFQEITNEDFIEATDPETFDQFLDDKINFYIDVHIDGIKTHMGNMRK